MKEKGRWPNDLKYKFNVHKKKFNIKNSFNIIIFGSKGNFEFKVNENRLSKIQLN